MPLQINTHSNLLTNTHTQTYTLAVWAASRVALLEQEVLFFCVLNVLQNKNACHTSSEYCPRLNIISLW